MTQSEWDTLRLGDRVFVHSTLTTTSTPVLHCGVVAIAGAPHEGRRHVAIRMLDSDDLLWPRRLRVHRDPVPAGESCAWCPKAAADVG